MRPGSRPHHTAAWLACFAILLAALAPSISQFVYAARQDTAALVAADHCVPAMADAAAVSGDHDGYAAHAGHGDHDGAAAPGKSSGKVAFHFEHCHFCATTAASFALLPLAVVLLFGEADHPPAPAVTIADFQPRDTWTAARPRGPPAPLPRLT